MMKNKSCSCKSFASESICGCDGACGCDGNCGMECSCKLSTIASNIIISSRIAAIAKNISKRSLVGVASVTHIPDRVVGFTRIKPEMIVDISSDEEFRLAMRSLGVIIRK